MEKPILSICIPTYNRASCLDKCLEAIVAQEEFNRIEVVVSDNCSSDNTPNIVEKYSRQYPNIGYYRNTKNLIDENFPLALQRATGMLRKLTNDTIIYNTGAISYMVKAAEDNIAAKPQIYFLNSGKKEQQISTLATLDDYLGTISYNLTWIGSIALWDDDCGDLSTLVKNAYSKLGQVPFLLENFTKRKTAIIYDRAIMTNIPVEKKDLSYGLFQVFYNTFLNFIEPLMIEKKIKSDTYENIRKDLLFDFFLPWIYRIKVQPDQYRLAEEDLLALIDQKYKKDPYYHKYIRMKRYLMFKAAIKKMVKK